MAIGHAPGGDGVWKLLHRPFDGPELVRHFIKQIFSKNHWLWFVDCVDWAATLTDTHHTLVRSHQGSQAWSLAAHACASFKPRKR